MMLTSGRYVGGRHVGGRRVGGRHVGGRHVGGLSDCAGSRQQCVNVTWLRDTCSLDCRGTVAAWHCGNGRDGESGCVGTT